MIQKEIYVQVETLCVCCVQELRERVLRGKYRVPFYMSTDCEGILRRFLVLNPTKRCSLEVRRETTTPPGDSHSTHEDTIIHSNTKMSKGISSISSKTYSVFIL